MFDEQNHFIESFNAKTILVKSMQTGEVMTLDISNEVVLRNPTLDAFEVRDNKVVPKYNFTRADADMVNIHAHKGPDEPNPAV